MLKKILYNRQPVTEITIHFYNTFLDYRAFQLLQIEVIDYFKYLRSIQDMRFSKGKKM